MIETAYRNVTDLGYEANRLVVLFGQAGSGKSYVGQRLREEHDYNFYDSDVDLTPEQLEALRNGQNFTKNMRVKFFERVFDLTAQRLEAHPKVAVAQCFDNDCFRRELLTQFPYARFVLVDTSRATRMARIMARPKHTVPVERVLAMDADFEDITVPYTKLINS